MEPLSNITIHSVVVVEDDSRTICFNCSGAATPDNNFHVDSYWMSQYMSRYLSYLFYSKFLFSCLVFADIVSSLPS